MEKDEIRRFDSFQAFEEICALADKNKVSMSDISVAATCFHQLWQAHLLFNI
jgi:double-strand break repair protein MRE11